MPESNMQAQLSARAFRPLVAGMKALGHPWLPLVAEVGIEPAALEDPDAPIPMRAAVDFLARAVETTGDTNLGLHLAESAEPGAFDVHLYAMLSSATLGEAFGCLCRYQRLIHESSVVELRVAGDLATLRHRLPGGMPVPRHSAEFIVTAWVRAGRLATAREWSPVEVRFAHPEPPDPSEHGRFFRAPVRFDQAENGLVLPVDLLDTPCVGADPALLEVLHRYATDRLEHAPLTASFADRARTALVEELRTGEPRAARLAVRLKMSVRTLHRALAAEGTSYRRLLEQVRKELAMRHLADPRVSISEVAFLLGFSELSAFHRAFKRWTGLTPATFRKSRSASDS